MRTWAELGILDAVARAFHASIALAREVRISQAVIDRDLLPLLACPEDHTPLHLAEEALVARLNRAIATGVVHDRGGQPVQEPVEGGLVRADGKVLYPILQGIPVLLIDRAISLDTLS